MNAELEEWLKDRPQIIRDLARKYPPGSGWLLNGQPCEIYSYYEDGTVSVLRNSIIGTLKVFGVDPETLEQQDG